MNIILMVCTGNICRSPMAEGLLKRALAQAGQSAQFSVASAGVWTDNGLPASQYAQQAMAERGIDISAHRSRVITDQIIVGAALILTMTHNHAEAIRAEFPSHKHKVYMLSEMSGTRHDVADPIGGTLADYQAAARQIERLIEAAGGRIVELAGAA